MDKIDYSLMSDEELLALLRVKADFFENKPIIKDIKGTDKFELNKNFVNYVVNYGGGLAR